MSKSSSSLYQPLGLKHQQISSIFFFFCYQFICCYDMFVSSITELVSVEMSFNKTNRNSSGRYIKVKFLNV